MIIHNKHKLRCLFKDISLINAVFIILNWHDYAYYTVLAYCNIWGARNNQIGMMDYDSFLSVNTIDTKFECSGSLLHLFIDSYWPLSIIKSTCDWFNNMNLICTICVNFSCSENQVKHQSKKFFLKQRIQELLRLKVNGKD